MDAEAVIEQLKRLSPEEKRKVQDFVYKSREEELRQKVDAGIDQLSSGEYLDLSGKGELRQFFDDIKARGMQRLRSNESKA